MVDHGDLVAYVLDLVQEVRTHEDESISLLERLYDISDLGHASRVQTRRGLIEQDDLGVRQKCCGNIDPLLHSFGEFSNLLVQPFVHLYFGNCVFDGLASLSLGQSSELCNHRQCFSRCERWVDLRTLDQCSGGLQGFLLVRMHLYAIDQGSSF